LNLFLLQDVTHEAITVLFKCKECGSRFYRTYEIVDKEEGKTNELGYYGRVFGTKNVSNKAYSYYTLENVFDRMWSGESYDFLKNNCKHWCRQFRAYLSPY
jgi:hypothetical protein